MRRRPYGHKRRKYDVRRRLYGHKKDERDADRRAQKDEYDVRRRSGTKTDERTCDADSTGTKKTNVSHATPIVRAQKGRTYNMRRRPYGHKEDERITRDADRTGTKKDESYDVRRRSYGHKKDERITCDADSTAQRDYVSHATPTVRAQKGRTYNIRRRPYGPRRRTYHTRRRP
ncbi:hypothetical protein AVEN_136188-1 [Araneus ventricosus]|uniref:Uncharacterized protein n=1 Tax=Araneus ventricosus TaxID=182803 RepID=A0A4Y2RB17_ARAVE|nr:hypothetical protein AVEN_136188-1 [Araneus ventricosus]